MEIFWGKSKIKQQHWLDRLNQCPVSWTGISTCDVTATSSIWTPILVPGSRYIRCMQATNSPPCLRGCLKAPFWSSSLKNTRCVKKSHKWEKTLTPAQLSTTALSSQLVRTVLLVGRPVSSCQQVVSSSCNTMIRSSFLAVAHLF